MTTDAIYGILFKASAETMTTIAADPKHLGACSKNGTFWPPEFYPHQPKRIMRWKSMEHRDETASLISAGKVQGTNVYNTQGERLGELYDVMIDKRSGRIAYAVMSFGGILGMGNNYHPLPWNTLKY